MNTSKIKIRIECANGDSFAKGIATICRYWARTGLDDAEEVKRLVRESIERRLENCEVVITQDGKYL